MLDVNVVTENMMRLVNAAAASDDSGSPASASSGIQWWVVLIIGFALAIVATVMAMAAVMLCWICCPDSLCCPPPTCLDRRQAARSAKSPKSSAAASQRSVNPQTASSFDGSRGAPTSLASGNFDSQRRREVFQSSRRSSAKKRMPRRGHTATTSAAPPFVDQRNPLNRGMAAVPPVFPQVVPVLPQKSPQKPPQPMERSRAPSPPHTSSQWSAASRPQSFSFARSATPTRSELVLATIEEFDTPERRLQRHESIVSHMEGGFSRDESIRLHLLHHPDTTEQEFGTFIMDSQDM